MRRPEARSAASQYAATEPLPFVPAIEQRRVGALGVAHLRDQRPHRLEPELHPEADALGEVRAGDAVGGERAMRRRAYRSGDERRHDERRTRTTDNGQPVTAN